MPNGKLENGDTGELTNEQWNEHCRSLAPLECISNVRSGTAPKVYQALTQLLPWQSALLLGNAGGSQNLLAPYIGQTNSQLAKHMLQVLHSLIQSAVFPGLPSA